MIMFLSYIMLTMTDFLGDNSEIIYQMGYVFITLFGILVVGNLVYIFNVLFERYARTKKLDRM